MRIAFAVLAPVLFLLPSRRCQAVAGQAPQGGVCAGVDFTPVEAAGRPSSQSVVPRRISVVRIHVDGCAPSEEFRTTRLTWTIEPILIVANSSNNNDTVDVSTIPPNLLEPVYTTVRNVGFLSFAVTNATAWASSTAAASLSPVGVRVQLPHDQLSYLSIEYGNPFYVQVLPGFTQVSTLALSTGYSLMQGPVLGRGLQLKADLSTNTVPLNLQLNGNGAIVNVVSGSVVESLQFSGLGSRLSLQGTVSCASNNFQSSAPDECFLEGGSTAPDNQGRTDSTSILIQGSIQGTIATRLAPNSASDGPDALTVLVNDPTSPDADDVNGGGACAAFVVENDGSAGTTESQWCHPTNLTAVLEPWFQCATPVEPSAATTSSAEAVSSSNANDPLFSSSASGNTVWCASSPNIGDTINTNTNNNNACSCTVSPSRTSSGAPVLGTSHGTASSIPNRAGFLNILVFLMLLRTVLGQLAR